MDYKEYIEVICAVCGSSEADIVYENVQPVGFPIGNVQLQLVMCRCCGFVYTNPRVSQQVMLDYYSNSLLSSGATYHDASAQSPRANATIEEVSFIRRYLTELPPGRLLDIGASYGDLLSSLNFADKWELTGVEPSASAVTLARKRGLHVIHSDIDNVDIDLLGKFDVICMQSVLEHLNDPKAALSKISSLLNPNGILFLTVPNSCRPFTTIAEFYSFEHVSHFTLGTLSRLIAQFGFEVIDVDDNVSRPDIRIAAVKKDISDIKHNIPDDREQLKQAISQYHAGKQQLKQDLQNRLEGSIQRWRRDKSKVAIYGAGFHTMFLFHAVTVQDCIFCVLDSNPEKDGTQFMNWTVYGPNHIDNLGLDAIIISSKDYQEEIYKKIEQYVEKGIEIVKCYT